jgi:uroporphyrinogen-III synthase
MLASLPPEAATRVREQTVCAAIGPTTAGALHARGARRVIQAPAPTPLGLVGAIRGAVGK